MCHLHKQSHFITFTKKGADFGADLRQASLKSKGFPVLLATSEIPPDLQYNDFRRAHSLG